MTNSSYRPEIDGLRAIAVVGVVLYHANMGVPGGYVGVDVFFVISGFLITGIILRAQEADRFSLLKFWERRLLRIFPALTVVVLATLGMASSIMLPTELKEVGWSAIAQALSVSNIFFWQDTNYFAGPAELKPLLHTWSLAVEEQFYFVLPVVLILLKKQSRKQTFCLLMAATILSFVVSVYAVIHHTGAAFFLLPCRAWELSFGCLLASSPWEIKSRRKLDNVIATSGLFSIVASMLLLDEQTPFPGLAALPSVAGTTAVIYATAASKDCAVARLLSFRLFVFVGLISYSLYLWHWPVLVFMRYAGIQVTAANVWFPLLAIFGVSCLSWRFIERPFREQNILSSRKAVFLSAVAVIFVCVSLSAIVVKTDGLKQRFQGELLTLVEDTEWRGREYVLADGTAIQRETLPAIGVAAKSSDRLDFVLWGDSHGMMMSSLVDDLSRELGLRGVVIARTGKAPLPNVWSVADTTKAKIEKELAFGNSVMAFLANDKPRNLILVCRWSAKCEGMSAIELAHNPSGARTAGMVVDGQTKGVSSENSADAMVRQFKNLVRICDELGIAIWVVQQVPESSEAQAAKDILLRRTGVMKTLPGQPGSIADHERRQKLPNRIFDSLVADGLNVKFIDPALYFFDAHHRHISLADGRAFYRDDDHLTKWGLERLRPLFRRVLSGMAAASTESQAVNDQ